MEKTPTPVYNYMIGRNVIEDCCKLTRVIRRTTDELEV